MLSKDTLQGEPVFFVTELVRQIEEASIVRETKSCQADNIIRTRDPLACGIDGELARYQKRNGSKVAYSLVDAETANVWG